MSTPTRAAPALPESTAATSPSPDLGANYGRIGISAVAAAVRFKGETRNSAYAPRPAAPPTAEQLDRHDEAA